MSEEGQLRMRIVTSHGTSLYTKCNIRRNEQYIGFENKNHYSQSSNQYIYLSRYEWDLTLYVYSRKTVKFFFFHIFIVYQSKQA